jgi:hypothetical protein
VIGRLGWSRASGYRFIAVFSMFTSRSQIETEGLTIDASSLYRIAANRVEADDALKGAQAAKDARVGVEGSELGCLGAQGRDLHLVRLKARPGRE